MKRAPVDIIGFILGSIFYIIGIFYNNPILLILGNLVLLSGLLRSKIPDNKKEEVSYDNKEK